MLKWFTLFTTPFGKNEKENSRTENYKTKIPKVTVVCS